MAAKRPEIRHASKAKLPLQRSQIGSETKRKHNRCRRTGTVL